MISINDVRTAVNSAAPYTYYANEFPTNAPDDCGYVRLFGGFGPSEWTPKQRPTLQVVVRAKSGVTAEQRAWAVFTAFHRRLNWAIGTQKVSSSFADQSVPLYLGLDENNRPMYSINFTLTYINGQRTR